MELNYLDYVYGVTFTNLFLLFLKHRVNSIFCIKDNMEYCYILQKRSFPEN